MSVDEFINQLLSYEEYAFSFEELVQASGKTETAVKRELSRVVDKGKIINLRKGFYIILPPRYQSMGRLPIELFIDKLFRYLNKSYYVSLYSASRIHGAGHQKIQKDYVMTELPATLDIDKGSIRIHFFNASNWPKGNIMQRKSDAGVFNVASPALTAVDLIHYHTKIGGLNRMLANLEELIEEIKVADLQELLTWYPHKSTLQRFGFLMDELQIETELDTLIFEHLKNEKFFTALLTPVNDQKPGSSGNRWKIDVNIELESDL